MIVDALRATGLTTAIVALSGACGGTAPAAPVARTTAPSAGPRSERQPVLRAGVLLVAQRGLGDPNFAETVVILVDYHPRQGALGLVLNRPADVPLSHVAPETSDVASGTEEVYWGGPVGAGDVFVLLRDEGEPDDTRRVFDDVHVGHSAELLRGLLEDGADPATFRIFVGYAGWGPGQVDRELARGDWLVVEADAATVFDENPGEIWRRLAPRDPSQWARRPSAAELLAQPAETRRVHPVEERHPVG